MHVVLEGVQDGLPHMIQKFVFEKLWLLLTTVDPISISGHFGVIKSSFADIAVLGDRKI